MMTAKVAVGIIAAALLLGLADARAQAPEFDRTFRDVQKQQPKQKGPPKQQARQKREPTRVIVRPVLRNRHDATEFPRTDNLGYPGPNAVRQCVSWLATEHRMSGTVVTPQMRCWWQRG
jgi:hypothetical protein